MTAVQTTQAETGHDPRVKLQNFLKRLNAEPNPAEVRVNQFNNGAKYLPISFLEMALDEYFFGLWQTTNFRWERLGNEIVGCLDLAVFHPVAQTWITRTGTAATMIRLEKGARPSELDKKIINALEMDVPHLKADCLRNAVQSLGKLFGRDLNRQFADQYKPIVHQQAIEAGHRTVAQVVTDEVRKAEADARAALELARMDDRVEDKFELALSQCETAADFRTIEHDIRQYIPAGNDPAKQSVEFDKRHNGR